MNYLLRELPAYQMVEVEQISIISGLAVIIGGMVILYFLVKVLFFKRKKQKGGKRYE